MEKYLDDQGLLNEAGSEAHCCNCCTAYTVTSVDLLKNDLRLLLTEGNSMGLENKGNTLFLVFQYK